MLNENIRAKEVRLIGAEGEQLGVVPTKEALHKAISLGLDLVEVAATANPPVCKILDYGKFKYHEQKKAAQAKKNQVVINVKEITLRPVTEENDYQVKLKKMIKFLGEGDKLKVTMRFRGREVAHKEIGLKLMQRIEQDLLEYGKIETKPKMEGRLMSMSFGSLTSKKSKSAKDNEKKMAGQV
ncbi:MAG TPA: translation initiation factor IF-3 [Alphaproteobacteria bacterium]|nr:translation initiation factor IF-3 [Alphaproteobacteria bacterium]